MAFKLPCFSRKKSPANQDLPGFRYEDLQELEIIGHGSFGAVFTARRRVKDDVLETGALETVVVKKMLGGYDDKEFVKEARMLNEIQHQNVVRFEGFCPTPCAIMLEYVFFDFSPFGENKKLNSLQDFLGFVDENDDFECFNKFGLHSKIAKDIAKGLSHLHARDIVHRDLKSANVLVSNQHYCHLSNEKDRGEAFQKAPIVCKLTDFGESRSRQLQTALVVNSRTQRMNRGTPVFCAPEAYLHQPEAGPRFAIDDLKQVDVWAYGMILFHLINPNLRYPYQTDLEASQAPPLDGLRQLLQQKTKPTFSDKYNEFQATDWLLLENLYHACTQWDPSERPPAREFVGRLDGYPDLFLCENIPLQVSQASALQAHDHNVAQSIAVSSARMPAEFSAPDNDGTNACSFLCTMLCHDINTLRKESADSSAFQQLPDLIESVISELPREINQVRSMELCYVDEAYRVLRNIAVIPFAYEFKEEILHAGHVFSQDSRQCLRNAVEKMASLEHLSTALFCCEPYVFLVGKMDGQLFLIDTHPVGQDLGGNGEGGLLKIFTNASSDACESLCSWIWKRLRLSGALGNCAAQSFLFMTPDTRYFFLSV